MKCLHLLLILLAQFLNSLQNEKVFAVKDYSQHKFIDFKVRDEKKLHKIVEILEKKFDDIVFLTLKLNFSQMFVPNNEVDQIVSILKKHHAEPRVFNESHERFVRSVSSSQQKRLNGSKFDWKNYYTFEDIMNFLDETVKSVSISAEILTIGQSFEGRDLKVFHINPGKSKKKVVIDGGIHAREWISSAVATYIINELTANYEKNKKFIDNYDWHILPINNPDGYVYSQVDRFWRKNRSKKIGKKCVGVDLNRNFNFQWGKNPEFATDQCHERYPGSQPDSEPETKAYCKYFHELNKNQSVFMLLDLHSWGQMWLSSWGYKDEKPENYNDLEKVMKAATDATMKVHGKNYSYGISSGIMYSTYGFKGDWATGVEKIKYSFSIELRDDGKYKHELPPQEIIPTAEETWIGIQVAIEKAESIEKK